MVVRLTGIVVLALVTLAAACATSEKKGGPPAPTPEAAPAPAPKPAAAEAPKPTAAADTPAPSTPPLYFAFDSSTLESESGPALQKLGTYLVKHPDTHIVIEGNTDEVGTPEYNLALGQRRAKVAVDYLLRLGVRQDQIRTVSYGEEHPAVQGAGEAVWRQNRRDEVKLGM